MKTNDIFTLLILGFIAIFGFVIASYCTIKINRIIKEKIYVFKEIEEEKIKEIQVIQYFFFSIYFIGFEFFIIEYIYKSIL